MPELPDIELYLHALQSRIVGQRLDRIRLASPFLVRSFDPPIDQANGKTVRALRRLGKRLVWELDDDLFLVIHLMIAGRFKWASTPGPQKAQKEFFQRSREGRSCRIRLSQRVADPDRGGIEAARIAVSRARHRKRWRRTIPAASKC